MTSGVPHSALASTTQLQRPPLGLSTHDSAPALTTRLRCSPLTYVAYHSTRALTTKPRQYFANRAIPREWQRRLLCLMAPTMSTTRLHCSLRASGANHSPPTVGFDSHHLPPALTTRFRAHTSTPFKYWRICRTHHSNDKVDC